jgi:3-oxoacyl-[acyl-carrier protein] reductase
MVAVISGATKGVGKALAIALAKEGFSLALNARNKNDLEQLQSELLRNYSSNVFIYVGDLSDKNTALDFSSKVLSEFKNIDVLINNVGKYDLDKITDDGVDLDDMMKTNLNSAYYLTKHLSINMCKNGKGHIFNICSVLSLMPRSTAATYTISKHALKGFNDVLREEMREYGVKVTAIYPGSINTSSWEGIVAPKELFVQPDDIVNIVKTCLHTSKNANIEEIVIKPLDKKY